MKPVFPIAKEEPAFSVLRKLCISGVVNNFVRIEEGKEIERQTKEGTAQQSCNQNFSGQ